ncbi:hypothetical protein FRACA_2280008 [Frankia canadensis]|uniref:Uncharacterized protein n=1 Tax=Frankia canadensis TaxID=1836972 RepID=A0A2I2KRC8_9ACTN|nr:hypothetical protein FRACA_2280008 [Frankia canadensis]SOU55486.1 hypothetical protein FRACA_2280008 [Frankia canadensis]
MDPDHGMRGPVLPGDEDLAKSLRLRRLGRWDRVVVVVRVLGPEPVSQVAQGVREITVGRRRVGDEGVAAERGDGDAAQRTGGRRAHHEGHVGVPVVGAALGRVHAQHVRAALQGGDGRVRPGEFAEAGGESLLPLVVEFLAPEEQRLVFKQCLPDGGNGLAVEVDAQVEACHLGADPSGYLAYAQIRTDDCHGWLLGSLGVAWRDQWRG